MSSKAKKGYVLHLKDLAKIGQKYLCNSCTFVLRDPVQTTCGHHYCRVCLDYLLGKTDGAKCLKDGILITTYFPDTCIGREVLSITVHCIYVEEGCDWCGEIRVFETHLEECSYVRVACMFPSCGKLVKRRDLAFHLESECSERVMKCGYCEISVPLSSLKLHESTKCKSFPETCGLCMKKNIPREQLKFHYDECEEVEKECAFAAIGCKTEKKMKRSARQEHNGSFIVFHLSLLLGVVIVIRDQIQLVLSKLAHFCDEVASLTGLKEKVSNMMSQITALIISNTEIREEMKLQGARTKALEDNFKAHNGEEVVRQRHRNGTSDMSDDYQVLKRDYERLSQAMELMQATLRQCERELQSYNQVIGISGLNMTDFEQDIRQLEKTTYKGTFLWKVTDFAKRKREAINGINPSFYSPYFYSSRYGYKMRARIYLNGDGMGKGTHISLFFVIMRGEYDALLRWPFTEKVTMMILDHDCMEHVIDAFRPDPASSSFQRPVKEMNVASGCPMFCPLSELSRHAYVREDCMFVKIIVDETHY